jgi:hypothetical protein
MGLPFPGFLFALKNCFFYCYGVLLRILHLLNSLKVAANGSVQFRVADREAAALVLVNVPVRWLRIHAHCRYAIEYSVIATRWLDLAETNLVFHINTCTLLVVKGWDSRKKRAEKYISLESGKQEFADLLTKPGSLLLNMTPLRPHQDAIPEACSAAQPLVAMQWLAEE